MDRGSRLRLLPDRIGTRLFLLILLVLVPMLLLLVFLYLERYEARKEHALLTELEVAQGVATTFSAYLEDLRRASFAVGQAILLLDPQGQRGATRLLSAQAAQYDTVRNFNWVNPQGTILASSHPALVGANLSDRPYFQQILSGRPWAVGDLTRHGKAVDAPTFASATAIHDDRGALRGVVVVPVDPDRLGELTLTHYRPAEGAYSLFDSGGRIVFRRGTPLSSWEDRVLWKRTDPLLRQALARGTPQGGVTQFKGQRWVLARVPIPEIGWVVGAGRPLKTILAPVNERLIYDAILAILISSAGIVLAWFLARSIAGPIQRLEQDAATKAAADLKDLEDPRAPEEVRRLRLSLAEMASSLLSRAEALRKSEEKFRAIFEQAVVGMGRVSFTDARWIDVNDAFCRMLGYSREEMLATAWPKITHPVDVDLDLGPFRRMAAGELESYSVEKRFFHKQGHIVWARLTLSLVRDPRGSPEYEIAVIEDITERKKAEEELHRFTRELERRVEERTAELSAVNRELEAFTYTVSHDLRAPLRHITSFVELLGTKYEAELDETGQRYLRIIAEAGHRMGDLIEDLLTFSRLGRAPVTKIAIDLQRLTQEVRRDLAPDMQGRRIEWQIEELPTVQADPGLLRIVFSNLLSNALKYTRHRDPAVIALGCRDAGEEVVCFVRDNGAGFDMRYADKLFGVFQRLHRAEEFEGTGIGLASVRRIIERHGGRTWAEGEIDRGAIFYFSLPQNTVRSEE